LAWVPLLGRDSQITFYASVPGTFVDLAADLAYALGNESLRLDGDIPSALVSNLTGVRRLSTINEAVGVLIGHGHSPDGAQRELRDMADTVRISIHQAAEVVIASPSSARWD
jgi:AmiR/NasT family two-component response regulator